MNTKTPNKRRLVDKTMMPLEKIQQGDEVQHLVLQARSPTERFYEKERCTAEFESYIRQEGLAEGLGLQMEEAEIIQIARNVKALFTHLGTCRTEDLLAVEQKVLDSLKSIQS
jgi:hypothetical protein